MCTPSAYIITRLHINSYLREKKTTTKNKLILTLEPGPSSQPSSWLTLQARLMAEILRGCVTTMLQGSASLPPVNSSSKRN